jgi:uncharacterized membrane protein
MTRLFLHKKGKYHLLAMIGFAAFFFFCLSLLVIAFLLLPWARFFSAISSTVAAFLKKGWHLPSNQTPLSGDRSSAH